MDHLIIGDFVKKSSEPGLPIYQQLKNAIAELIQNGSFSAGASLPSIRRLSEDNQISPLTAKRVLDELASEGLIKTIHGKGSFVASDDDASEEKGVSAFTQSLTKVMEHYKDYGYSREARIKLVDAEIRRQMEAQLSAAIADGFAHGLTAYEMMENYRLFDTQDVGNHEVANDITKENTKEMTKHITKDNTNENEATKQQKKIQSTKDK